MNGENDFPWNPPLFITQGKTLFFCSLAVRMISRDAILYHLDDKRDFFALLWDCLGLWLLCLTIYYFKEILDISQRGLNMYMEMEFDFAAMSTHYYPNLPLKSFYLLIPPSRNSESSLFLEASLTLKCTS